MVQAGMSIQGRQYPNITKVKRTGGRLKWYSTCKTNSRQKQAKNPINKRN
jgi:hypothetical protein